MKRKTNQTTPSCNTLPRWCLVAFAILIAPAYAQGSALPKPIFKLAQGHGKEVCEAYLRRLEAIEFLGNDPTKGRVNEPLLDGFADLRPMPLTAEEIKRIILKINSFELYQDQNAAEDFIARYKDAGNTEDFLTKLKIGHAKDLVMENEALLQRVEKYVEQDNKTPFVRYQTKLDLDNDGIATNTVIKNNNSIYIVDDALQQLDEERMMAILADQEILHWPSITVFPPLALPITVFGFKGKYYFDGFQNLLLDSRHPPRLWKKPPMLLKVFSHESYQTQQVCEYQWLNATGEGIVPREYTR